MLYDVDYLYYDQTSNEIIIDCEYFGLRDSSNPIEFYVYATCPQTTLDVAPYAAFSDLITVTIECGGEVITASNSGYGSYGYAISSVDTHTENLMEDDFTFESDIDVCPITYFVLYDSDKTTVSSNT